VDLPSEDPGNIPDTTAYDKEYHRLWNSCSMATMGIGQDKLEVTPLQMANAMCIVANRGYYYTPHFVKNIEGAPEDDTLLSRFHQKHEPVTHISNDAYEVVQRGMQDVTEIGTGRPARIPGIDICSKTGTAENKRLIDGRIVKLKSHSWFVCFAPRENPKIAVAVIIENGGYGGEQAAPIASLLVEKYLNDTIATSRLALVDDITNRNLMPRYLVRLQYRQDSLRAAEWARQSGDSTRLLKYQTPAFRYMMMDTSDGSRSPLMLNLHKPSPYKSALAERLAKQKAQAAAAAIGLDTVVKANAGSMPGDSGRSHAPRPLHRDSAAPPVHRAPPRSDSATAHDTTP
jgi:penicillin-binding protein 2